jgi:hypothetical protein
MHIPRVCICIGLFLVALFMDVALLGIGALSRPVTSLVAVKAWLVVRWPL